MSEPFRPAALLRAVALAAVALVSGPASAQLNTDAGGSAAGLAGKYRGVAIDSNLVGIGAGEAMFILTALEGFDWVLQNRRGTGSG
jgi:hypothetical protein